MTFAQGSRSGLSYVVESTFGTTPGSPNMIELPFNTHSLDLSKTSLESAEIRSDRQTKTYRHGMKKTAGDIAVDFRADDYDDLLESAFQGAFTLGVLKVGTTRKYVSIEDRALDISVYRLFTGCAVNTLSMNFAADQIITATFGMVGKTMTQSGSSVDSSPTSASTNEPFDGNNFVSSIKEGGGAITTVTQCEFNLNNNMNPTQTIAATSTTFLESGRAQITGTLTAYFEDSSLINKFINETESSLEIILDDGVSGNGYTFYFPRIKYSGAPVPVSNEQSRMIQAPFVALYDSTLQTNLRLTKN